MKPGFPAMDSASLTILNLNLNPGLDSLKFLYYFNVSTQNSRRRNSVNSLSFSLFAFYNYNLELLNSVCFTYHLDLFHEHYIIVSHVSLSFIGTSTNVRFHLPIGNLPAGTDLVQPDDAFVSFNLTLFQAVGEGAELGYCNLLPLVT